jgi:hypothetical protein
MKALHPTVVAHCWSINDDHLGIVVGNRDGRCEVRSVGIGKTDDGFHLRALGSHLNALFPIGHVLLCVECSGSEHDLVLRDRTFKEVLRRKSWKSGWVRLLNAAVGESASRICLTVASALPGTQDVWIEFVDVNSLSDCDAPIPLRLPFPIKQILAAVETNGSLLLLSSNEYAFVCGDGNVHSGGTFGECGPFQLFRFVQNHILASDLTNRISVYQFSSLPRRVDVFTSEYRVKELLSLDASPSDNGILITACFRNLTCAMSTYQQWKIVD